MKKPRHCGIVVEHSMCGASDFKGKDRSEMIFAIINARKRRIYSDEVPMANWEVKERKVRYIRGKEKSLWECAAKYYLKGY